MVLPLQRIEARVTAASPPPPAVDRLAPGRLARWILLALAVAIAVGLYFRNAKHTPPLLPEAAEPAVSTP